MRRAAYIFGALFLGLAGAGPAGGVTAGASAAARATIVETSVVRMNWATAMPSVRGGASGASFMGTMPSMMMGMMMMPGNAGLSIRRQDDAGDPVTAPTSFEVIRTEGENTLIVRTAADTEVWIARDGAIVGGSLEGSSAASIGVGRGLIPISNLNGSEAAYSAALVIVVQYN